MDIQNNFPAPVLKKDDRNARILIWTVSILVFIGIAFLSGAKLNLKINFDPHIFATLNAIINSCVAVLLIAALIAVKSKKYLLLIFQQLPKMVATFLCGYLPLCFYLEEKILDMVDHLLLHQYL